VQVSQLQLNLNSVPACTLQCQVKCRQLLSLWIDVIRRRFKRDALYAANMHTNTMISYDLEAYRCVD